ncbi:TldD/PmbA family protein [Christensenellaceae bacterium OttesenSCG-928-L17]|nr:TldD/PmbA family protein [Christensenellaceae bacterium OttesenSCG-928-L17]
MIEREMTGDVLKTALRTGGDFAELYMEDTHSHDVSLVDTEIENAVYAHRHGAGVRVFWGTQSAYAYTNDTSHAGLVSAANAAADALCKEYLHPCALFSPVSYISPSPAAFENISNDMRGALLSRMAAAAKAYAPEISQVRAGYMDTSKRVLVCNSEGVFASTDRIRTRIQVQAIATDGTQRQVGMESKGFGLDFSAYENLDVEALGIDAAKTAVTMLRAPECPAGFLPVVIDGGFGGVIFHEACGHSLEATAVAKGNSEFCGKRGQKIASPLVTAVDDGTIPGEWGSVFGVDDEGTPSQKTILIENGILQSYLIDRLGARRMGLPPTGCARRQNYAYAPTSRMSNTYIAPGKDDEEEMIASMAEGLYAKKMGGGSVDPLTGTFNFSVREGYWVKNGKIDRPVRGATLVGKGADVLLSIDRVGPRMWMAPGMCGSASGSIPTNVGQPRIRVSGMTIGGAGSAL